MTCKIAGGLSRDLTAVALQACTLRDYIATRDPVSGGVYVLMLLVYAAMPWVQSANEFALHAGRERYKVTERLEARVLA